MAHVWDTMTDMIASARDHLARYPALSIGSVGVSATDLGPRQVEVYVPTGAHAEVCAHLLAWWDSLDDTSLLLKVGDDPEDARVLLYGRLVDGIAITVVGLVEEDALDGVLDDQFGEWVLHWLREHAV
ncbi:hypothetical protein CLV40_13436 [Actinokineospora auranticolor]|uniref:Uncharacterized protein n=2 Tax=Actinokineospora auranticolor TaxID=155976 RepID=A0A2S6GCP2_9PSEU|nr:hypothetical protein CLV40_13436 [Actinokineospora auranticolor]